MTPLLVAIVRAFVRLLVSLQAQDPVFPSDPLTPPPPDGARDEAIMDLWIYPQKG
jgi:hypothetical protein